MTAKIAATGVPASSWKPYPAYKDSGVEWLGKVPEGWKVQKLKHIAKVNLSNVDKKTNEGEDTLKLCNYVDVYYNDYITPDLDFMEATASSDQIDKFALREGDVIITKDSESWEDIAIPAYVPADLKGVICGYHLAHVRPNYSDIYGEYLFWSLCAPRLNHQFRVEAHGITRFGLGKYGIDNSLFLVPPINVQKFIARYLDDRTRKIDSLIEKKQKMIELLKEERAAVINQAVTKGLDPDAQMKGSGIEWLGEVPEKWELRKISRSFNLIGSGATPESGNKKYYENGIIAWINTGDLNDGILESCEKKITNEAFENYTALKIYPKGTILVAMYGATIGKVGLLNFEGCTNQACCALGKSNFFIERFVFYWFLANKRNIVNLSFGGGQPNISQEIIKSLKLTCPPIEEQQSLVRFIESESAKIDSTVSMLEKELLLLQEYRTALISEVVTGKIDVREMT